MAASASEARRGRNANRSLPASVLRANRYPSASIRPYFVPVGPPLAAVASFPIRGGGASWREEEEDEDDEAE